MNLKCPKCALPLKSTLTRSSVIIDVCTGCKGVWFDRGEINFFVADRKSLEPYARQGLTGPKPVLLSCPKCEGVNLRAGKIPGFNFEVEECPSCKGLFLDEHEFRKIGRQDTRVSGEPKRLPPKIALPSLGFTTAMVLGSMYSILFGLMVFLVEAKGLSYLLGVQIMVALILLQFLIAPVFMDWSLRLFGSLSWVGYEQLPAHLAEFIRRTCAKERIPLPEVGLIEDGAPQAYTYGRTPRSARLVISRGILEFLEPEEVEAVIAHEIGHITHWDFVVMTLAQLVPLALYHLYRIFHDLSGRRSRSSDDNKGGQYFLIAAIVAYFAYLITQYLVMFVSRVREYWADRFSVEATRDPNALVRALGKVAYGLVAQSKGKAEAAREGSLERKRVAIQSMGIMSITSSKESLLYSAQGIAEGSIDLKEIMRWDLWSPWAAYYELHSTHPLTAKRINAIGACALSMGIQPAVVFDLAKPESYWDDFFWDLAIVALPFICGIAGLALKFGSSGSIVILFLLGFAIGGLVKTLLCYPGEPFQDHSIRSLLKMVKVSPVRAYPVKLKGQIVGRGDPGRIFSEDMVIRDSTGMIFLDYQHGLSNWYFAFFKMDRFMGQDVEVEGWYRRAPIPYVEVRMIRTAIETSRSYGYFYKTLAWMLMLAAVVAAKIYLP